MSTSISRRFTPLQLIKFAMPTMIMMVFMSLYTIVDGVLVSRFVGFEALSAINIVLPVTSIVIGFGVMLGTGGSAIIGRQLGEGKIEEARKNFTLITLTGIVIGIVFTILGLLFIEPIIYFLGASGILFPYCYDYLYVLLLFIPAFMIQIIFQNFFVLAGKPDLGLSVTVISGVTNAILDYLFIVKLQMGIAGAAWATITGYIIAAVFAVIYFRKKSLGLHFVRPWFKYKVILEACFNGSSEMVTNLAASVITLLYNILMMRYIGESGVAAVSIILYAQFLFTAMYLGFSGGVAPVISFNFGSKNIEQLKRIFKICMVVICISSIGLFIISIIFASPMVSVFAPKETEVYDITIRGYLLFSTSYIFAGINIFASSMFTALSNGKVSAVISFMRTFIFILMGILLLPLIFQIDGLWLAIPFAELMTLVLTIICLQRGRKKYHYA